jgi:hypothetical protein
VEKLKYDQTFLLLLDAYIAVLERNVIFHIAFWRD